MKTSFWSRALISSCLLLLVTYSTQVVAQGDWGNYKLWAVNYDPQKNPPSGAYCGFTDQSVAADLQMVKGITGRVRIYSLLGCDVGKLVLRAAQQAGLKVWLGMWVGNDGGNAIGREIEALKGLLADSQIKSIIGSSVEGVVVGSEALYRKDVTDQQLIGYMGTVKNVLNGAGFPNIAVTTADVVLPDSVIQAADVVLYNNFPFWGGYSIDGVADTFMFLIKRTRDTAAKYGKKFLIGETGWPSRGKSFNPSNPGNRPGTEEQNRYLNDIVCRLNKENIPFFYFQAFDMLWDKTADPGSIGVDRYWGIFNADRTGKNSWINIPSTCPTPPQPSNCVIEDGLDYPGNDMANLLVGSAELCCGVCQNTPKCAGFAWSTYGGGTCYLKSSVAAGSSVVNLDVRRGKITSSPSSCTLQDNVDYVGNDVGSASGVSDPSQCCAKCKGLGSCKAFTWTNFNGGTCWFKSSGASWVPNMGAKSAVVSPSTSGLCSTNLLNVDFPGNDIGSAPASQASDCCGICSQKPGCYAFSWNSYNGGTCWLKSAVASNPTSNTSVTSAPVCSNMESGTDFVGADIGSMSGVPKAETCCGLCYNKQGCKAVTWLSGYQGGTCFFKSGVGGRSSNALCRSAVIRT